MKEITVKYNVKMTFAFLAYALLLLPFTEDESPKMFIDSLIESNLLAAFLTVILCAVLSVAVSMLIIRSLWNRLIVKICKWDEINLAEAYAMSLFMGMFVMVA